MKTIEIDAKVNFHAIELTDGVIMSKLMDSIKYYIEQKKKVHFRNSLPEEERNKYEREYYSGIEFDNVEDVYNVLCKLGFVCSNGDNTIHEATIDDLRLKDNK